MEGVRIHVDEYSCSLCEHRAGLNLKCCCPDDPEQLLSVSEEHFRRRISLKIDQKLCSMHLKKLKRGLLFGRADWYECCAPFHVKSPQSSRLRPVPHSWKSYFESPPTTNNRYHPQQRICWKCYMLAMDTISSGLDDTIDEEYQSASFDLGYMSPRRWAPSVPSPCGSQARSTWSLAHPSSHSSITSPPVTRKMDDTNNRNGALRKRARISGGRFLVPTRSLDRPSPQDRSLIVPKQASDATELFSGTQRNLIDELEDPATPLNSEEQKAFTSGDFVSIPQYTTMPEETQSSAGAILDILDREKEELTDLRPENKEDSSESEDSSLPENEETGQTGRVPMKPKLDCKKEIDPDQNKMHHTVLETDRNAEKTQKVSEKIMTDGPHSSFSKVFNGAIGNFMTTEISNRNTKSLENLSHDESITHRPPHTNSNLANENVVQSCPHNEERSSTSDIKPTEGWERKVHYDNDNSEEDISGNVYVESFNPKKSCEGNHKNNEARETVDWPFSTTFAKQDRQQDDGFEIGKMGIAEERFDPIVCDSGSKVSTSDEEASIEDRNTTDEEAESKDKSSDNSTRNQFSTPITISNGGDSNNIRTNDTEKVAFDEIAGSLHQDQVYDGRNNFENEVKLPKTVTNYGPHKTLTPTLVTANESSGIVPQNGIEIAHSSSDDLNEKRKFVKEHESALKQSVENMLFELDKRPQEPVKERIMKSARVERAEDGSIFEGGSEERQEPELLVGRTEKSVTQEATLDENDLTVGIDDDDVAADDKVQCGLQPESSSPCVTEQLPRVLMFSDQKNSTSKLNGAEGSDEELSEYQTSPDSQEFPAENISEQEDFVTKTNLYTELHGSNAEVEAIQKCSVDAVKKSDEIAKVGGEFNPGPVTNEIPTLRSGNRSDDGERLQFLRRRMGNRSCSLFPQSSNHADFCAVDENHPKITSYQLDAPSLNRRSLWRDKRRKLGVTFAIDPRTSIVRDEPPALTKILQSGEEKKDESSKEEHIDSSEVAPVYQDSGEGDGGSEKKESPKASKKAGLKENETISSSEDEDVSAVLSEIFHHVFTLKTVSEFIQSFNTGSSVQTLVVTLVTVIVVLLFLLAIFVFVF